MRPDWSLEIVSVGAHIFINKKLTSGELKWFLL